MFFGIIAQIMERFIFHINSSALVCRNESDEKLHIIITPSLRPDLLSMEALLEMAKIDLAVSLTVLSSRKGF